MRLTQAILLLALVALLVGCNNNDHSTSNIWLSPNLEEVGMEKKPLEHMLKTVVKEEIKSIFILKDGTTVLEYYRDQEHGQLTNIYSCTKGIVSACLGIALEQGAIDSIEQPISDFFPDLLKDGVDPRKQAITLRHLLTMTSGIDWPEWTTWNYGFKDMRESLNWVEFVLARPMAHVPGKVFNYNSGGSHLLAAIIQEQTGMSLPSFATEHLFTPLGIKNVEWPCDPQGYNHGGSELRMSTSDMAKVGQLYLNLGKWEGKQVIPEAWVIESTAWQSGGDSFIGSGYGYQWWLSSSTDKHQIFFAMGYGGQLIYVVPELSLVAVFTSWSPENPVRPEHFLQAYIIPAAH